MVRSHYQLLGVVQTAAADEIRRAFRREIARYHPDKVQHLGPEFQEMAATRGAELTEAYRVLMDAEARRRYDQQLENGVVGGTPPPPTAPPVTVGDFLRKAALARLQDSLVEVGGSAALVPIEGFDVAYLIKPRRTLFRTPERQVRLLVRFVLEIDGASLARAWLLATKSGTFDGVICLMLLGAGVSPSWELGSAVAEHRRKVRTGAPVVVAVHVRDWEAWIPPDAPDVVHQVVHRLKSGV